MAIGTYRKRPVEVQICGPWDGKVGTLSELRMFVAATNPGPAHAGCGLEYARPVDELRVWNEREKDWINTPRGHYIVRGIFGETYPIDPESLVETYEQVVAP